MPAAWFVRANSGVGIVVVLDEVSNTVALKFSLLYTPFTIFRYRFITIGMISEQSSNVPCNGTIDSAMKVRFTSHTWHRCPLKSAEM